MLPNIILSEGLVKQLIKTAKAAGVTPEYFVALATAEKIARFEHRDWLFKNKAKPVNKEPQT